MICQAQELMGWPMNMTLSHATLDPASSVAVVITTYNHAAFLDDAIRSIIRQSIPAEEIIVVDDGSTDHPDAVVSGYSQVRLIRQRNQGLSAAPQSATRSSFSTPTTGFAKVRSKPALCASSAIRRPVSSTAVFTMSTLAAV
jgi:hypothetical protein